MKYTVPIAAWCFFALASLFLASCRKDAAPIPTRPDSPHAKRIYVILGSSTALGVGSGIYDSSWVGRCIKHLPSTRGYRTDSIINLAVQHNTSYAILPGGNSGHNITKAFTHKPFAVIINLPSNDIANGTSVDEQMRNFATVAELCQQQRVELWVTTSQPRNTTSDGRAKLFELKTKIELAYGTHSLDFWTGLAEPDGTIKSTYGAGDGVHLNAYAHRVLFSRVKERVFSE